MILACLAAALLQLPGELPGEELEPLPDVLAKLVPGVRFEDVPVRRAVRRLAAANGAAAAFVRGVDPTTPVSLDAADLTVAEAMENVVRQGGAAAVALGGAIYVAPPAVCTAALKVAAERRDELGASRAVRRDVRERALAEQDVTWEDLATPRAILDDVAARFRLSVENPDAVPHDLWPAGRLPTADAPAALAAVLTPCGLTFVWTDDRTGVRIAPLPGGDAAAPPSLTTFAKKTAVGQGGGAPLDRRRFTLTVKGATVRQIMDAVDGVRFEFDPRTLVAGGGNLDARVAIDVTNADADTFFTALFAPAGVAFQVEGTTVNLFAVDGDPFNPDPEAPPPPPAGGTDR